VTGANFDPGDPADVLHPGARVALSHPGLTVLEVQRDACGQLRVRVEAAPDALPGWSALTVENVDVSAPDPAAPRWIFGRLEQALEVLAPPVGSTPTIVASRPAAGERGVSVAGREVRVAFDRDLGALAELLTPAELRRAFRVRQGGQALPHAIGSPAFEDGGRTVVIRLREPLRAGLQYTTSVQLASAELRAALEHGGHAELAMTRPWTTAPGWTTVDALVAARPAYPARRPASRSRSTRPVPPRRTAASRSTPSSGSPSRSRSRRRRSPPPRSDSCTTAGRCTRWTRRASSRRGAPS
jgi:hypothetical protein